MKRRHKSHRYLFDRKGQRQRQGYRDHSPRSGAFCHLKLKASVDKNRKGFAFLVFDDPDRKDLFVSPREASRLFHGDRVEVHLSAQHEILDLKIIEHRFKELVGRYSPMLGRHEKGGFIIYERKRAREEVFVSHSPKGVRSGDWVRGRLKFHSAGPFIVTAEIVENYGQILPARADVAMISAEFNLEEHHSETSEKEAKQLLNRPLKPLAERKNLTSIAFVTIDGETARDFDDAIFVERKKSGFVLWVAIADVSHFVKEGSELDQEARSRGTSVYFPERAFHMLPTILSENLCSLKSGVPRLTLTAKMNFNWSGERTMTQIFESTIQSHRRATYNEIQKEREENQRNPKWEFSPHFDLYQLLRNKRKNRGSMDFDMPEAEIIVDEKGDPVSITKRDRLESHRLIEEFMIEANEAVTEWAMERKLPFIYRTHDEPSFEKISGFQKLAEGVGVSFVLSDENLQQILSDLIRRLEGHPAQDLLNMALLRSLKQAVYRSTHGIHFGLASQAYTHFTSPIRRYPDLIVHRLLKLALAIELRHKPILSKPNRVKLEKELEEISEHCSYRERLADMASREAMRIKQVRALLSRLGDEFEARIVGIAAAGLFVGIENPFAEGLISIDSLLDDVYQFNEEKMVLVGRRKKKIFKIGDPLQVRLLRADLDRRQIDFGLLARAQ